MGSIILCESDGCAFYAFNVLFLTLLRMETKKWIKVHFLLKLTLSVVKLMPMDPAGFLGDDEQAIRQETKKN